MKVLVIAPHPDDEVLGVGGTIARHNAQGDSVTVCIVTKGQPPLFPKEGYKETRAEAARAHKCLGGGEFKQFIWISRRRMWKPSPDMN